MGSNIFKRLFFIISLSLPIGNVYAIKCSDIYQLETPRDGLPNNPAWQTFKWGAGSMIWSCILNTLFVAGKTCQNPSCLPRYLTSVCFVDTWGTHSYFYLNPLVPATCIFAYVFLERSIRKNLNQ